jgi:hypothetical protein
VVLDEDFLLPKQAFEMIRHPKFCKTKVAKQRESE